MTIGQRIKQKRKSLGITQQELAKRVGCKDKSSVSKIEKSDEHIAVNTVLKYADALECSIVDLML